ncbi:hypothetical protein [Paenibacillus sp. 8b26]|uniref:hypothetical protein n=1 Tax=Paenibacillus sp. 8b26 TaxID=3424133 RepID=UPI003D64CF20
MDIISKIDSQEFNNQYGAAAVDRETIKQKVCSVKNNKMITQTIVDGEMEFTESIFDPLRK